MSDVNLMLTAAGQILNAKIQMGDGTIPLQLTRIMSAAGFSENPTTLMALIDERQEFTILNKSTSGWRTTIRALLSNIGNPLAGIPPITEGYPLSQIGFYAMDPDIGEILYRISQFETPNFVPSINSRIWEYEPEFTFVTENASEVTIIVDPSGLATKQNIWDSIILSQAPVPPVGTRLHLFASDEVIGWPFS
jgi:hypothetical protein